MTQKKVSKVKKVGSVKKSTSSRKKSITKKSSDKSKKVNENIDIMVQEEKVEPKKIPEPDPIPSDMPGIIKYLVKNYKSEPDSVYLKLSEEGYINEILEKNNTSLIKNLMDGELKHIESEFVKIVFGEDSHDDKLNELKRFYQLSDKVVKYNSINDVIIIHKDGELLGEKLEKLSSMRDEYTEEKYIKMLSDTSIVSKNMGYKIVSLIGSNMNNDTNSIVLNFTTRPDFETHTTPDCIIFGRSYEIKIPKKPLHPAKKSIKEYIESGVNPYSNWDNIFRDLKSNVIYAMSNKNNILLLVRRYYLTIIDLIACELSEGKEAIATKVNDIYEKEKAGMIELFTEKTQNELTQNYRELDKDIKDGYIRLEELSKQLAKIGRVVRDAERDQKYFNINAMMEDSKVLAQEQFKKLYKIPQVSLVQYSDGYIIVYTNNIYKKDGRTQNWHDMGTFKICISWSHKSFSQESIKIYPTKWNNTSTDYWCSHVFKNSNMMCLGNTTSTFAKNYANRDVFGVVFNVIDFLKVENLKDSASISDMYPIVPEGVACAEGYKTHKKEVNYMDLNPDML